MVQALIWIGSGEGVLWQRTIIDFWFEESGIQKLY